MRLPVFPNLILSIFVKYPDTIPNKSSGILFICDVSTGKFGDEEPDKEPFLLGDDEPFLLGDDEPFLLGDDEPFLLGDEEPFLLGDEEPFLLGDDEPFLDEEPSFLFLEDFLINIKGF